MTHWKKLDHVSFLLMIVPCVVILMFFDSPSVVLLATSIEVLLWTIALLYDIYEKKGEQ